MRHIGQLSDAVCQTRPNLRGPCVSLYSSFRACKFAEDRCTLALAVVAPSPFHFMIRESSIHSLTPAHCSEVLCETCRTLTGLV